MKKLYYNSGYFFLILFAIVLAGFYKTYFGLIPRFDKSTTWLVHVHAALLITWVVLLIVQPLLIRYKKTKLHKLVGKFTYVLVPLMLCSMVGMILKELSEEPGHLSPLMLFMNMKLASLDTVLFTLFYTLAVINRKNFQLHGAFMIATGLIFINPGLARFLAIVIPGPFAIAETITIAFIDLIVLSIIFYLKQHKLSSKPYGLILSAFLVCHIIIVALYIWGPKV